MTEDKEEAERGGLCVDSGEVLARQWSEAQDGGREWSDAGSWKGQGEEVEGDEEDGDFLGVSAE